MPSELPSVIDNILELVLLLLKEAGCEVAVREIPDVSREWILAENEYFVAGVCAVDAVDALPDLNDRLTGELIELATSESVGSKRWDFYLLLLCRQGEPTSDAAATSIYSINYDTSYIRRIVVLAVEPGLDSVRDALRPLLPIRDLDRSEPLGEPLEELEQGLVEFGMDSTTAARAIAAFRQAGSLSDA